MTDLLRRLGQAALVLAALTLAALLVWALPQALDPATRGDPPSLPLVEVQLWPEEPGEPYPGRTEQLGTSLGLVALALEASPGVVVRRAGRPLPAGQEPGVRPQRALSLCLDLQRGPRGILLVGTWCEGPACQVISEEGPSLEPALDHLLTRSALTTGLPLPPGLERAMPQTGDPYAWKMTGRALATLYGLREEVPLWQRGDRRRDPVARAPYLDPRQSLAWRVVADRPETAPEELPTLWQRIAELEGTPAARAAWAGTLPPAAAWRVWTDLGAVPLEDPRFFLPMAKAALAAGQPEAAAEAVARLESLDPDHPTVAVARVALADASGGAGEAHFRRWAAVAPTDPEPIRRLVRWLITHDRPAEALDLTEALAARGARDEALDLGIALAANLGDLDRASALARQRGLPELARQLGASRGEVDPETLRRLAGSPEPPTRLAAGRRLLEEDPKAALALTRDVLRLDPWLPEALALEAQALTALGQPEAAAEARQRLALADPRHPEAAR